MNNIRKPKLAIVDLTDCEGCQVEFFALKDRLPNLWQKFDIISWRMGQDQSNLENIDVLLIEGSPIKKESRERIIELRKKATLVGTLGSCADLGGINAILKGRERTKAFRRVYSKNKPLGREVKPLSQYIKIDFRIPGCPIRPNYLAEVLSDLLIGKNPQPKPYPVCFECKLRGNECLLLKGEPCLGPITAGGCQAICPSQNHPCFGCFGLIEGAQTKQMKNHLEKVFGKKEASKVYKLFLNNFN